MKRRRSIFFASVRSFRPYTLCEVRGGSLSTTFEQRASWRKQKT